MGMALMDFGSKLPRLIEKGNQILPGRQQGARSRSRQPCGACRAPAHQPATAYLTLQRRTPTRDSIHCNRQPHEDVALLPFRRFGLQLEESLVLLVGLCRFALPAIELGE